MGTGFKLGSGLGQARVRLGSAIPPLRIPVKMVDRRARKNSVRCLRRHRLLLDATLGDSTLFTRSDEVECSWQFFAPVLEVAQESSLLLPSYRAGTWGPEQADQLLARDGRRWKIFPTEGQRDRCYI